MKSARQLDRQTFRALYTTHVGFVQFIARQAGCKDGMADDVVQETFVRLLQNPPTALDERVVRAWLALTAKRIIIDEARKRRREPVGAEDVEGSPAAALWFRDEEAIERELEILSVRELVDEIAAMPGGDDFLAFYVDGLKAREIAGRRGESVSSVTTRLSRLRRRLREQFKNHLQAIESKRV